MWPFKKKTTTGTFSKETMQTLKTSKVEDNVEATIQNKFEAVYTIIYRLEKKSSRPSWTKFFDLVFVSREDVIRIANKEITLSKLITLDEINETAFKIAPIYGLINYLANLVDKLVKMYTDGENNSFTFADNVKELKKLALIDEDTFAKLKFFAKIKSKIAKADRLKDVKYTDDDGSVYRLFELEGQFKLMYFQALEEVVDLYIEVQEPFLDKFYNLYKHKNLTKETAREFYLPE
ncbi:hypothetical protein ACFX5K_04670 [Rickettsiales bacterium LUAb2]